MREFLRGLLTLLLALGMSTVFVACDVDDEEAGAGGAEAGGAEAGGAEAGGAEAGGAEAGGSETADEAADSGAEEVLQMMTQVEDDLGVDANGGLGDGCRDPETLAFGYCSNTDSGASSYSDCEGNSGTLAPGLCADAAGNTSGNVVCCTGYRCGPSSNPDAGVCAPEVSCDVAGGSSVMSGLCPGGATIKCCLPDEDTAAEMQAEEDANQ